MTGVVCFLALVFAGFAAMLVYLHHEDMLS